ncbi:hypothetical protein TMatcc_000215 [Talaromyces marneffei ATCC 18224]|uniref:Condensation domain-containing protein n=1 Tax=Talaromyces marneffei (strain ATCC 18224 / CBS 334.59 / QM 7333) TaxID=441960 RepID=B6QQ89_TALMQ|nr:uncharacterized protein EYB26_005294 [Talaromyces marneffei]EEA20232.1 conserved hypothetical protein [Talaromyces marneffei ATCC 18224]KAE8549241.1 hypothetical protein EYB25_007761 [Talaromyces marneffei]QGA17619.1 hypothetical protein EYB26_005294 [Talaromyces marneffei]
MSWSQVDDNRYERALRDNETFIKMLADSARQLNREHWAINVVATVTPMGSIAMEDLISLFREAWKALRFKHPTIAAYVMDETRYIYDVPDETALTEWATETFRVVDNRTVDEVIASTTVNPYATMTYFPQTCQLPGHAQHWRTDGVGGFMPMDDFLDLASRSVPVDTSSLPWGEETRRLAPSIEEAAGLLSATTSEEDKKLAQQTVAGFGLTVGAIGIASHAAAETVPGGTRISCLQLSEQETNAVVKACKDKQISVTAAVHASVAGANYALAAPEDKHKHYTSTIRFSFRPFLPKPYSGREYASTIFTSGWMFPVLAELSWAERAMAYHAEYRKGLTPEFISAHREYAIGLCNLLQSMPAGPPSPYDVDISSLGVIERLLAREKGTPQRGILVDQVSGGLEMVNRQCVCHVWTFRNELYLNLVYNEAFYEKATMDAFVGSVKDLLLQGLSV